MAVPDDDDLPGRRRVVEQLMDRQNRSQGALAAGGRPRSRGERQGGPTRRPLLLPLNPSGLLQAISPKTVIKCHKMCRLRLIRAFYPDEPCAPDAPNTGPCAV